MTRRLWLAVAHFVVGIGFVLAVPLVAATRGAELAANWTGSGMVNVVVAGVWWLVDYAVSD